MRNAISPTDCGRLGSLPGISVGGSQTHRRDFIAAFSRLLSTENVWRNGLTHTHKQTKTHTQTQEHMHTHTHTQTMHMYMHMHTHTQLSLFFGFDSEGRAPWWKWWSWFVLHTASGFSSHKLNQNDISTQTVCPNWCWPPVGGFCSNVRLHGGVNPFGAWTVCESCLPLCSFTADCRGQVTTSQTHSK